VLCVVVEGDAWADEKKDRRQLKGISTSGEKTSGPLTKGCLGAGKRHHRRAGVRPSAAHQLQKRRKELLAERKQSARGRRRGKARPTKRLREMGSMVEQIRTDWGEAHPSDGRREIVGQSEGHVGTPLVKVRSLIPTRK